MTQFQVTMIGPYNTLTGATITAQGGVNAAFEAMATFGVGWRVIRCLELPSVPLSVPRIGAQAGNRQGRLV